MGPWTFSFGSHFPYTYCSSEPILDKGSFDPVQICSWLIYTGGPLYKLIDTCQICTGGPLYKLTDTWKICTGAPLYKLIDTWRISTGGPLYKLIDTWRISTGGPLYKLTATWKICTGGPLYKLIDTWKTYTMYVILYMTFKWSLVQDWLWRAICIRKMGSKTKGSGGSLNF